jgi:hypothetical protein
MQPAAHIVSFFFLNNILQYECGHALISTREEFALRRAYSRGHSLLASPFIIWGENGEKSR